MDQRFLTWGKLTPGVNSLILGGKFLLLQLCKLMIIPIYKLVFNCKCFEVEQTL